MSRQGPKVTLDLSCDGCEHERSASYAVQGDSGFVVSCAHPEGKGRIGDTTWDTPDWCPLRAEAIREAIGVALAGLPDARPENTAPSCDDCGARATKSTATFGKFCDECAPSCVDEPSPPTGLDIAFVGDAEGIAALCGLDAPRSANPPATPTHERRCRIRWRGIACEKRGDHNVHGTNDGLSMWLGHVAGITVDDEDGAV